jgi:hypothetical protein
LRCTDDSVGIFYTRISQHPIRNIADLLAFLPADGG